MGHLTFLGGDPSLFCREKSEENDREDEHADEYKGIIRSHTALAGDRHRLVCYCVLLHFGSIMRVF